MFLSAGKKARILQILRDFGDQVFTVLQAVWLANWLNECIPSSLQVVLKFG